MRVKGNVSPPPVSVELLPFQKGYALVRLRENVTELAEEDAASGKTVTAYSYDEYTMTVKYHDGLQHDVESDLANWLATGRTLELNEQASAVCAMKDALRILGVSTDEN